VAGSLAIKFGLRELRGGLSGFRIFLACLALGVAAIAAAGSTAEAFRQGLASQAREIVGGDLSVTLDQRPFSPAEQATLGVAGRLSYATAVRAMAEVPSGARRLVELRGVDQAYPLSGTVELDGAANLADAFKTVDDVPGAAVDQSLLDKFGLHLGDRFNVGTMTLRAAAVVKAEPDRLGRGFALGPRVMISREVLARGGFLVSGLPATTTVRIVIAQSTPVKEAAANLKTALGRGFRIRTRDDAAPGLSFIIDQLDYFLSFIGLTSLIAGGLGVFGAVSAYLQTRQRSIAVLKALGASGALVRNIYLFQIALLALLGVVIGLAIGATAPLILGLMIKDQLPVPALFALYPKPLIRAGAFGLLSAAAFSLAPLGQARRTSPASLFRQDGGLKLGLGVETTAALVAAAGLAALAFGTAPTPLAAGLMIVGVTVAFGVLWVVGLGLAGLAGKARRFAKGPLRLGIANLSGPRSAAHNAAPAIGLGVALLATVVLIQSSLLREVTEVAPQSAPAVVYTDIPGDRVAEFDALLAQAFHQKLTPDRYIREPLTSGRIIAVRGQPVERGKIAERGRWAFDNDIQMSVIGPEPDHAGIVAGHWWPADYSGDPLVALDQDAAAAENIRIGDAITLSVLGREFEAKVAALRKVEVGAFGANFSVVLDPAALEGATLRNVAIAKVSKAQEDGATHALGAPFPQVNIISVREQLEQATTLFDRLSLAVRAAAAVAGLAGVLVLAGAIAARARARTVEAAMLKVLGASRAQILSAYVLEYGAVGVIAGVAGVALGYLAAWPVVVKVFHAKWSVDWGGVVALVLSASLLAAIGGVLATLQALSQRPASALRGQ
jgi:putative ABC transport system permease protein